MRKLTSQAVARLLLTEPPLPTPLEYLTRTPVFRHEEFRAVHASRGRGKLSTAAILAYHVRGGRLLAARRGLYVTSTSPDPWLLGSRLTEDAVLAYSGALSFHGLTPLGHQIAYLTGRRSAHFAFNEVVYQPVRVTDASLLDFHFDIEARQRSGLELKVTTRERALVDVLERHDLGPPLLELVDLLLDTKDLEVDRMVLHARRLENRVLNARLGYVLSWRRGVSSQDLAPLERDLPTSYAWFDPHRRKGNVTVPRWRLLVPPVLARAIERR